MPEQRILIIDDDGDLLRVMSLILSAEGRTLDAVRTWTAARALLDQHSYDLVIVDWMLPDVRGLEVVDALKEIDLDYRVILMSGYLTDSGDEDDITRDALLLSADRKGVFATLQKPLEPDTIRAAVDNALAL